MPALAQTTLRERKKAETHARTVEVAQRLFKKHSYDGVTLARICSEAAISKRTFFRYFRDKESLVFPRREERLAAFVAFLRQYERVESPFDALRDATRVFGAQYNDNRLQFLAKQQIVLSSPALLAREREIDQDWEQAIARGFSIRSGNEPSGDLWSRVLAGAIMGVVRSTMTYWFERNCEDDLIRLGLDALDCLEEGFPKRSL